MERLKPNAYLEIKMPVSIVMAEKRFRDDAFQAQIKEKIKELLLLLAPNSAIDFPIIAFGYKNLFTIVYTPKGGVTNELHIEALAFPKDAE